MTSAFRVVRVVDEDLGGAWTQKAARIRSLVDHPHLGERRFRTVLREEPVRAMDAA